MSKLDEKSEAIHVQITETYLPILGPLVCKAVRVQYPKSIPTFMQCQETVNYRQTMMTVS